MWWSIFLLWVGYLTFNQVILAAPMTLHGSKPKQDEKKTEWTSEPESEAEALRRRIAELEAQNQAILKQLAAIEAQIQAWPSSQVGAVMETSSGLGTSSSLPLSKSASAISNQPRDRSVPVLTTEGNESQLSFYGFVRVDAIFDDSRPDAFQVPTFIRSEDSSTGLDNDSNFAFHPRLTRIGMNYQGPVMESLGRARISGKVETDFQNGGRESRGIARYRHLFMKLSWESSSLLLGQTSDIIAPLFPTVNNDTLMWNAGNLGDRRMQIRYSYERDNGFSLWAGLGLTGAVDSQDLDQNGVRDGEASTLPNIQARLGYRSPRVNVGMWTHYAQEETDITFGGERDFNSYSLGVDYELNFNSVVGLKGELWRGSNLSDFRGGIGQAINTRGEEIDSRGGWIEMGLKASRVYSFSAGFTFDDPENEDILSGGRTENRAWYVTNRFRFAPPFMFGIDYLFWRTDFKDLEKGTDNRLNLYFLYNF
ncbi:hypothetical protein MYX75_07660 [Acidobacteria bacterium AH-259-A15]|nr:hypothetical protein [Acidobacteria bacterium AH-259-A15]